MEPTGRIEARIDRLEEKLEKKLDALMGMVSDQKADFAAHVATDGERFETIDERLAATESEARNLTAQHVTDLRKQLDGDAADRKTSKWWVLGIVAAVVASVVSPWFARTCNVPTAASSVELTQTSP